MDIVIREARSDDVASILLLSKRWKQEGITLGYEHVNWTEDRLLGHLSPYFYVAVEHGEVVGYCFGQIKQGQASLAIPLEEAYLEIYELYVYPEHRSRGIGKQLAASVMEAARSNGVERVLVGSSNLNWRDTTSFYERLGFKMRYVQMFK